LHSSKGSSASSSGGVGDRRNGTEESILWPPLKSSLTFEKDSSRRRRKSRAGFGSRGVGSRMKDSCGRTSRGSQKQRMRRWKRQFPKSLTHSHLSSRKRSGEL